MTIINFPRHKLARCEGCAGSSGHGCSLCAGGLALCVRCGGAEASIPTDCPGERMPEHVADAVYDGRIDYCRRRGWIDRAAGRPLVCEEVVG